VTAAHIKDQCLHSDEQSACQNAGGLRLLCADHVAEYQLAGQGEELGPNASDPASFTWPGAPKRLTLNLPLNGVYFDQIRDGSKLHEYRLITDFWRKRIVDRRYDRIVLTRGYPKSGGVEGVTRLTREWRGYHAETLTHPHFGPLPVTVYAIDVSTPATLSENRP